MFCKTKRFPVLLLFLTSALLLAGCTGSREKPESYAEGDLQTVTLEFADALVKLPKNFQEYSFAQLKIALLSSELPDEVVDSKVRELDNLQHHKMGIQIFCDTANFENQIWFFENEHNFINKNIAQQYLSQMEAVLTARWEAQNVQYQRVESNLYFGKKTQMIKIKYRISQGPLSQFLTDYIISTQNHTLEALIFNFDNIDYHSLISKIRMK